jgi:putative hemolysin
MTTLNIIFIVLLLVCVLGSAFFSVAEIAFISLQRFKLEHMIETKVEGASRVKSLVRHPERLLSTILLGNNFFNTAAAALGTTLAVTMIGPSGTLIATIAVTIILLVFADTLPKTTAAHHAESLAVSLSGTIRIISWIFSPVVIVLSWVARGFGKLVGAHTIGGSLVSQEEIRTMINVGSRDGTVEKAEAEMLHKVFEFGDRPAREIMVPRTEVTWVEKGTKIEDFFKIYMAHPYTRYPVFNEGRDNVVGLIASKDMLMSLAKGTCDIEKTIDDIIRPAYFAPASKPINDLLAEMRDKNLHMCIIVDEYGGTAGIVTLTQLVEEIIGDVRDELSNLEKNFEVIDEFTFQIDGGMRIEDVNAEMHLGIPEGDYETVAGFILKLLGHIPRTGEPMRYKDLKMVVTHMNNMKIEEVRVMKEKHATTADKV